MRRVGGRFSRGRATFFTGVASAGVAAPTITNALNQISTAVGDTAGGYTATITGTNLTGTSAVTFGGVSATNVTVVNSTTVTCTVPAGAAVGEVDVAITTPGGTATATNGWRYWDPSAITTTGWWRETRTTSGTDVTQWTDKSGNGKHLTPANPALRPQVGAARNGHETIEFTGVATCGLLNASLLSDFIANNAYTLYAAFMVDAVSTNSANSYENDAIICDQGQFWGLHLKSANPTARLYNWDGTDDHADVDFSVATWMCMEGFHSAGNALLRKNNGTQASAASGNSTITGALRVGHGTGTIEFDGLMAEIFLMNTVLDATTAGYARAYMMTRYAITP